MGTMLSILSVVGTFLVLFGLLYFLQKLTIGFLPVFKRTVFKRFFLGDLIFISTSLLFIFSFVEINPI